MTAETSPHPSTSLPTVAMLGVGSMAGAILAGLTRDGYGPATPIRITNRTAASAEAHAQRAGDRVASFVLDVDPAANRAAVIGAQVVVLGVKPGMVADLLDEIREAIAPDAVVISVAAGVTIEAIERRLEPGARVVRAMPNTPATIGLGVTGIVAGSTADDEAMQWARALFGAVGAVVEVTEPELDIVTGISGSGPACFYLFVESLVRAAESQGLDRERATALAVGTAHGAGAMLAAHPEIEPAELRRRVTSPGGTTEQAIRVFDERGLGGIVDEAVRAAMRRSAELAAENE